MRVSPDLLVVPLPGATLFDSGGLQVALEDLLGIRVELLPPVIYLNGPVKRSCEKRFPYERG